MKKFVLADIVIKTPGMQIRDKILEKYGTIEAYAKAINLYETSINQYLSHKNLGSSTFKIRTTEAFGVDFHRLYMTEEEQIRYFTSTISWYIDLYNQISDIQILEKLKKIVIEKEYLEDYAVVCRCYAYYYKNQGKNDRALAYIELAANYMRGKKNIDRFGLYLADLVLMKVYASNKLAMNRLVDELKTVLEKVEGPLTRGHIHYNLGLFFFLTKEFDRSKHHLMQVLDYIEEPLFRAKVLIKIGDIDRQWNAFETALQHYQSAETLLLNVDETIRLIYDRYASYYLENNELANAEYYADALFDHPNWFISSTDNQYLKTYAAVKIHLHKGHVLINVLNKLLDEIALEYLYTLNHMALLDDIIENSSLPNQVLNKMKSIIERFLRHQKVSQDIRNVLKQILGTISLK